MPRINDLAHDFAERFGVEPARAQNIARYMREAGMLSQGARGVNAPQATFLDATRLMIGMMLVWRPANRIANDVIPILKWQTIDEGHAKCNLKFDTFEQAIEALLKYNADYMQPVSPINHSMSFLDTISLHPHQFCSEILISGWDNEKNSYKESRYRFFDIQTLTWTLDTSNDLPDLDINKWLKGFYLEPKVFYTELIPIGHIVAGKQPLGWRLPEFIPEQPPSPEASLEILAARDENRQPIK